MAGRVQLEVGRTDGAQQGRGRGVLGQGEPGRHRVAEQELLLQTAECRGGGLFCLVDQHVGLQLVGVREIAGTNLALVRSLSGVNPDVSPEVRHLDKLSVTVRATIRLLSWEISVSRNNPTLPLSLCLTCMKSHVSFKMVVPGEPLVTFLTLEWFLAGVSSLVVLKDIFVAE